MEDYSPYILTCPAYEGQCLENPEDDKILRDLLRIEPYKSSTYTWDDVGIGELMIDVHDDSYRYCVNTKCWYIWENFRWTAVPHENHMINAVGSFTSLLLIYIKEAKHLSPEDTDVLNKYEDFIHKMRTQKKITDIVRYLATDVEVSVSELNWSHTALKTASYAVNLATGENLGAEKDYMLTLQTGTHLLRPFDIPNPRWASFIDEIMSHDKEKAAFLQRALGYSLLGSNQEECMFIAYGPKSRNGKGTLFSAIGAALGDYMRSCNAKFICVKPNGQDTNFDSPQPFLAELAGVRLVSMSEADESEMLSSAAVKTMTGRDDVTTRALYGRPFTYTPQFTMWLSTNYLPLVDDNTIFLSKRIWVIPFEECFAGKPDTGLKDLLTAPETRPTVLSWLLEGCQEYLKQGLNPPQSIIAATNRYNSGNDLIGRFLSACTEPNRSDEIPCGRLYDVYRAWCSKSENRFRPWATRRFYRALEMHGYVLRMENGGSQVVEGLKLKV